jgi:hypothetical protein
MTSDLDSLLRDAAPVSDEDVRAMPLDGESDLRAEILAHARHVPARRRRVRRWPALAVAAAAAGAVLLVLAGGGDRIGTRPDRAWAAPLVRVAQAVPRLLISEQGWTVSRADQFTVEEGEMTFTDGKRTIDLHWSERKFASFIKNSGDKTERVGSVEVPGGKATVLRYTGPGEYFAALWPSGRYTMELRSSDLSMDELRGVLASLREVSVDGWLRAMPARVVLPARTDEAVEEMLTGIPVPPRFDVAALGSDGRLRDRYQLGAHVAGAVACAWIERWLHARREGDDVAAAAAAKAMKGSRDWPILREMNAEGDYPEVLWAYGDAMAGDGTVLGGRPLTVEESYNSALGCDRATR